MAPDGAGLRRTRKTPEFRALFPGRSFPGPGIFHGSAISKGLWIKESIFSRWAVSLLMSCEELRLRLGAARLVKRDDVHFSNRLIQHLGNDGDVPRRVHRNFIQAGRTLNVTHFRYGLISKPTKRPSSSSERASKSTMHFRFEIGLKSKGYRPIFRRGGRALELVARYWSTHQAGLGRCFRPR